MQTCHSKGQTKQLCQSKDQTTQVCQSKGQINEILSVKRIGDSKVTVLRLDENINLYSER